MLKQSKITNRAMRIRSDQVELHGDLAVAKPCRGIVLFVHGSGSSRLSPRNRYVAEELQRAGLTTLLFDLLTEQEEAIDDQTAELRFDISLLSRRLLGVMEWVRAQPAFADLPLGLFGASTGAAAALVAAAQRPDSVAAVVSRGGRPDLAGDNLPAVRAPTLLIVGGADDIVIHLNEQAMAQLQCEHQVRIIPGATHLFQEPGALEQIAALARDWFGKHLQVAHMTHA